MSALREYYSKDHAPCSADQLMAGGIAFLYTSHNTILYLDEVSGELRHGPPSACPRNALLLACGDRNTSSCGAILITVSPGVAFCSLEGSEMRPDQSNCTAFEFSAVGQDEVRLKAHGLYLCAEPGGRVTLSREQASRWETFTISVPNERDQVLEAELCPVVMGAIASVQSLFDIAKGTNIVRRRGAGRAAIICQIDWLESYLASEHYHFARILHEEHGFDIIDCVKSDLYSDYAVLELSKYDVILVAWQGTVFVPINRIRSYCILKIDDLYSHDHILQYIESRMSIFADMLVGPYAYRLNEYFPHREIAWVPYSSAIEEECGVLELNEFPIEKILVSGSVAADRPFRKYVYELNDERLQKIDHPGYGKKYTSDSAEMVRKRWYLELNKFLVVFCDAHSLNYIHLRVFEATSAGALLLADRAVEPEMNHLGFVDYETCVFCDKDDFLDKVSWVLDPGNRTRVDAIRRAGMHLSLSRHTTRRRVSEFVELLKKTVPVEI